MFDLADSAVDGQATDLKRFLQARKNIPLAQIQAEISETFKIERSHDYVQISEPAGNVIYRSQFFVEHPLPEISPDDSDRPSYSIYKLGSERVRVISEPVDAGGHFYVVRVGHLMNEEYESLQDLRRTMLLYGSLILLVGAVAAYWISRRMIARLTNPSASALEGHISEQG